MAIAIFTNPGLIMSTEEKARISNKAISSYYAFVRSMGKKGKKHTVSTFGGTYIFIFLLKEKLVLIQYALIYDCLLIGAKNPLIRTDLLPNNYSNRLRKNTIGGKYTQTPAAVLSSGGVSVRSIKQRIEPEYRGIKTEVSICNTFNELPNNTSPHFMYLTCLSDFLVYKDLSVYHYSSIFSLLDNLVKSKITKAISTVIALEDSLATRLLISKFINSLVVYEYEFNGVNKDYYYGDSTFYNLYLGLNYQPPYLDYNSNIVSSDTETLGRVYPVKINALDATSVNNPYVITLTALVKYDSSYFFDISDNVNKVTVFDKTEEEISPANLRYLFDIEFPIDTNELQAGLRNYISFYFNGDSLAFRTEWNIYKQPVPYIVVVFDYSLEKDNENNDKVVNFDTEVEITITALVVTNLSYLADFNDPPVSPITDQILSAGDGWDGYNQAEYSFYNVSDQHTYYTNFSLSDHNDFYIPGIASHVFKAAALPSPKESTLPLVYKYNSVGVAPIASQFESGDITYTTNIYSRIHFNRYDTDIAHKSVKKNIDTYSGTTLTYRLVDYTGTSSGLPLPPLNKLVTYGIGYSYFNEVVVHKATGTVVSPYDTFLNSGTAEDSTIEFFIIPLEELTDIVSLIAYTENNLPIATIETGMQFEDSRQWQTNAGPSYNSFGSSGGFESYPSALLYYTSIHKDVNHMYNGYDSTNMIRWPVGYYGFGIAGPEGRGAFTDMQYPPNIQVVHDTLGYTSRNIIPDTAEIYSVERFHRIYLVNIDFEKLGYCDIIWSGALQMALHEFLQYQLAITNIALDNKDPNKNISVADLETINLATAAYEAFQTDYLSKILHNDFASYEFLYYLFGKDSVSFDYTTTSGAEQYMWKQDIVMIVTTTEYENATI